MLIISELWVSVTFSSFIFFLIWLKRLRETEVEEREGMTWTKRLQGWRSKDLAPTAVTSRWCYCFNEKFTKPCTGLNLQEEIWHMIAALLSLIVLVGTQLLNFSLNLNWEHEQHNRKTKHWCWQAFYSSQCTDKTATERVHTACGTPFTYQYSPEQQTKTTQRTLQGSKSAHPYSLNTGDLLFYLTCLNSEWVIVSHIELEFSDRLLKTPSTISAWKDFI